MFVVVCPIMSSVFTKTSCLPLTELYFLSSCELVFPTLCMSSVPFYPSLSLSLSLCVYVCQSGRCHGAPAALGLVDHSTVPKGSHGNGSGSRQGSVLKMCVCVGLVWWAAGCELSRPLSGQQEKDKQVRANKAASIHSFFFLFLFNTGWHKL